MPWRCSWMVGLAVALMGGTAHATTVEFREGDGRFSSDRYVVKGNVLQNAIEVAYEAEGDTILVADSESRVESSDCTQLRAHAVRCAGDGHDVRVVGGDGKDGLVFEPTGPGFSSILLAGGDGDDRLSGSGGRLGRVALEGDRGADRLTGREGEQDLEGGPGADSVRGGGGSDEVDGGPGNDLLRGGPGDDSLGFFSDELGVDTFLAGPGDDEIWAGDDDAADGRIDCGPAGRDTAERDRVDPRPAGCERVRRERP